VRRIGALLGGEPTEVSQIVDLNAGYELLLQEGGDARWREIAAAAVPPDMIEFLEGGRQAMDRAREVIAFSRRAKPDAEGRRLIFQRAEVRLLAPVPRPRTMRDFSVYLEHMSTRSGTTEKAPPFYHFGVAYKGNPDAVYGPEDPLLWPDFTETLDPELELCCVVGKKGRNLTEDEAVDHIAGFTIFCDGSARDVQSREFLGPYKAKDFGTNLGPCLVTPDEFDETNAKAALRVNGETWWEGNTGESRNYLLHQLVAYASDEETIHPGDVIAAGTIGLSCSVDSGKWIKPGDVVELWIQGIGAMNLTAKRTPRELSYVRDGMKGHLEIPESARDYPQRLKDGTAPPLRRG
jgi:2-keto-4-pentenoate hydratase/2-oxohepta-3-ene-1,7-dioic acid hydratase in catechol pathway